MDTADRAIRSIIVVGGGTAGWMAACALARTLGKACTVTLVESADIGTVGVGEATIPPIKQFNAMIGLDEAAFMRATQATYKLGIEFVDWGQRGGRYMHPFGVFGPGPDLGTFPQQYLRLRHEGLVEGIDGFSLTAQAALSGRMDRQTAEPGSPLAGLHSAYHFDAVLYAQHLRAYAERLGVRRVEGEIVDVALNGETGFVERLTLKSGEALEAELYIDCSGFRGLLIEGALQTGYEDWSSWLPVDRAVAAPCALSGPTTPYTRSTAREAGWQWRIPLQHRVGNGYVFASGFVSEDEATRTLLANLDGDLLAEPRVLRFVTGRRRRSWNRNVVALGLASGFLEPLESTSIHMVHSGIMKLLQHFPDRSFSPLIIDSYNRRISEEAEQIRDFIILHYHATERDDSPFWNQVRTMAVPDSLTERVGLFAERGLLVSRPDETFSQTSWLAVMLGQNIMPRAHNPLFDLEGKRSMASDFERLRRRIAALAEAMPGHDDYLRRNGMAAA